MILGGDDGDGDVIGVGWICRSSLIKLLLSGGRQFCSTRNCSRLLLLIFVLMQILLEIDTIVPKLERGLVWKRNICFYIF